jgi:hypothetical protein
MSPRQPKFAVGDIVCERFPTTGTDLDTGTVIETYELENDYRYVVKFESGREGVFFEREIFSIGAEK